MNEHVGSGQRQVAVGEVARALLSTVREQTQEHCRAALAQFIREADVALLQAADRAKNNDEQGLLLNELGRL